MVGWYGKGYIAYIFSKNPANFEEPSESLKMCLRNQTPLFSCLPEDIIPLRYGHSIQPYKAYQDKQYGKLKPVYLLPKDMLHSVI